MPTFRRTLLLSFALAMTPAASGLANGAAVTDAPPVIRKPQPVPEGPVEMPRLPPAEIDNSLAIGGEDIDARKLSTRLAVDAHVNGRGPYRFVVDSGADTSVVGLRIARDLELPLGEPVVLNAVTSRNIVDRVRVAELTVGASTFRNLHLPALNERHVGGDGLIGIDALTQQRLMMDFEKMTVKVEDARIPVKTYPGEIVITARRQRGQLILTELTAAGLTLDAIIDTGTEVTIGNMALRDAIVRRQPRKKMTVLATGVTGESAELELIVVPEIRVGSISLRNVPIAFADLPPFEVFGLSKEPALLLGTDLLENFRRVSLDFRSRKVRFQLRRCEAVSVTIHTSLSVLSSRLSALNDDVCRR